MGSIEEVAARLRSNGMELVAALQTTKEIKQQAFERLDSASRVGAVAQGPNSCRDRS